MRDRKLILEFVGAAGVIASLVFVGAQVRQSAEATRAATVLQLKDGWAQLNLTMMESPEIIDALILVVNQGLDDVDPRSKLVVEAWFRTLLHNWSNAYFQHRIGTLDDEQWAALMSDMEIEGRYRIVWDVWDGWRHIFDEPFQVLMDSLRTANFDPDLVHPLQGLSVP
jgi:hypothetical protein